MEIKEAYAEFTNIMVKLHAYHHAMGIIGFDAVTTAPSDTAAGRGKTLGVLAEASLELQSGDETRKLVEYLLSHRDELDGLQRRAVEEFNREYEYIANVPKDEYVAYQVMLNDADAVWHKAKAENDFASFAPYLEKIVAGERRFAQLYKPDEEPYNVLLNKYERGLDMKKADEFFGKLRERIVPLLKKIMAAPQVDDGFIHGSFPAWKQRQLSDYLMETMGIDRSHCNIGETEHPFTTNFNKNDVRITTNYAEDNFTSSMFSVIHEGGHALYELNVGDELEDTGLAGGVSMGIHESQSRLYENLIGRSEEFITLIMPKLKELFPESLDGVSARQLYEAVNKVTPSLIRTEADELTYCLHIMVRYDIEKGLIDGSIKVDELPKVWAEKMREYLGVEVPDDTRGVLQDSHWSGGSIGYFPSYALGSAYGAQMLDAMEKDFPVYEAVAAGDISKITAWLTGKIYKYGCSYDPEWFIFNTCGAPFDPTYYTDYLEKKYSDIYKLN